MFTSKYVIMRTDNESYLSILSKNPDRVNIDATNTFKVNAMDIPLSSRLFCVWNIFLSIITDSVKDVKDKECIKKVLLQCIKINNELAEKIIVVLSRLYDTVHYNTNNTKLHSLINVESCIDNIISNNNKINNKLNKKKNDIENIKDVEYGLVLKRCSLKKKIISPTVEEGIKILNYGNNYSQIMIKDKSFTFHHPDDHIADNNIFTRNCAIFNCKRPDCKFYHDPKLFKKKFYGRNFKMMVSNIYHANDQINRCKKNNELASYLINLSGYILNMGIKLMS